MVDAETIENSTFALDLKKIRDFEVRPDDIFLLTYPKSGTTWMKEIIPAVLQKGAIDTIRDIHPDVRTPYLEFCLSTSDVNMKMAIRLLGITDGFDLNKLQSPRVIVSHLRNEFLPLQFMEKKPKVIYVARNPKDVAVSMYNFIQQQLSWRGKKPYHSFGDFLTDFPDAKGRCQSIVFDGTPWRDHVLTWWNRRHEPNVLFLTFEDMKKDLKTNICKVAEFIDVKLDQEALKNIAEYCSFDTMKKNPLVLKSDFCTQALKVNPAEESPFVRKGKVGEWKEYLTVAENEKFDTAYEEWIRDSDLKLDFTI